MRLRRTSVVVPNRRVGDHDAPAAIEHLVAAGGIVAAQAPSRSDWCPEKKLAGAVLASALMEIRDHSDHSHRRRSVVKELEWIGSNDTSSPFSFLRLCELFDLNPQWVREVVGAWVGAPAADRRHETPWRAGRQDLGSSPPTRMRSQRRDLRPGAFH